MILWLQRETMKRGIVLIQYFCYFLRTDYWYLLLLMIKLTWKEDSSLFWGLSQIMITAPVQLWKYVYCENQPRQFTLDRQNSLINIRITIFATIQRLLRLVSKGKSAPSIYRPYLLGWNEGIVIFYFKKKPFSPRHKIYTRHFPFGGFHCHNVSCWRFWRLAFIGRVLSMQLIGPFIADQFEKRLPSIACIENLLRGCMVLNPMSPKQWILTLSKMHWTHLNGGKYIHKIYASEQVALFYVYLLALVGSWNNDMPWLMMCNNRFAHILEPKYTRSSIFQPNWRKISENGNR